MPTIRKYIAITALVLGLGASGAVPAMGETKTAHKYAATVQSVALSTADGYPAVGGKAVLVGTVKSDLFGEGALIDRVTITGSTFEPTVFAFEGTERGFADHGTLRSRFTGTATVQADGTQVLVIHGRVTGGTERYLGARGRYTFNGTTAPGSTVVIGSSKGKISY